MSKKLIKRLGVWQTAKVAAVIYFLIAVVVMIPFWILSSFIPKNSDLSFLFAGGVAFFILAPFLYAAVIYLLTALACAVYNLVAGWVGGIAVEFEEE